MGITWAWKIHTLECYSYADLIPSVDKAMSMENASVALVTIIQGGGDPTATEKPFPLLQEASTLGRYSSIVLVPQLCCCSVPTVDMPSGCDLKIMGFAQTSLRM